VCIQQLRPAGAIPCLLWECTAHTASCFKQCNSKTHKNLCEIFPLEVLGCSPASDSPAVFFGSKLVFGSAGTMGCAASTPPSPQRYNFVGPEVRSSPHLDAADWSELCGSLFCGWVAGVGPGNSQ
jgi:hypothetical protein